MHHRLLAFAFAFGVVACSPGPTGKTDGGAGGGAGDAGTGGGTVGTGGGTAGTGGGSAGTGGGAAGTGGSAGIKYDCAAPATAGLQRGDLLIDLGGTVITAAFGAGDFQVPVTTGDYGPVHLSAYSGTDAVVYVPPDYDGDNYYFNDAVFTNTSAQTIDYCIRISGAFGDDPVPGFGYPVFYELNLPLATGATFSVGSSLTATAWLGNTAFGGQTVGGFSQPSQVTGPPGGHTCLAVNTNDLPTVRRIRWEARLLLPPGGIITFGSGVGITVLTDSSLCSQ